MVAAARLQQPCSCAHTRSPTLQHVEDPKKLGELVEKADGFAEVALLYDYVYWSTH